MEFQKTGAKNKLSKLVVHLKELSEKKLTTFQRSEEVTENSKIERIKEIKELESLKEQVSDFNAPFLFCEIHFRSKCNRNWDMIRRNESVMTECVLNVI